MSRVHAWVATAMCAAATEIWRVRNRTKYKLDAIKIQSLMRMCRTTALDRVGAEGADRKVLKWFGPVERTRVDRLTKHVYASEADGGMESKRHVKQGLCSSKIEETM